MLYIVYLHKHDKKLQSWLELLPCHFLTSIIFLFGVNDLIEEHELLHIKSISQNLCLVFHGSLKLHPYREFIPPSLFTLWGCIVTKVVCANIVLDTTYSKEILKGSPNFIQVTLTPWNFEVHFDCWHFRLFLCTKQSRETLRLLSYKGKTYEWQRQKD